MMSEITDNLDELKRLKDDYYRVDGQSTMSKPLSGMDNIYSIHGSESNALSKIESNLRDLNPVDADIASQVES